MKTEAQKWGNSLAIRIPKTFARQIGLAEGSAVDLEIKSNKLVIAPVRKPDYELRSLLAGVKNRTGIQKRSGVRLLARKFGDSWLTNQNGEI